MATLRPSPLPPPPPPDAAVRERALDVRSSFLVRAPAGSGKTELLVRRFVALLGTVEVPEAVVAATFTRKAAAEMRARVLDALDQTWATPVREHLKARGVDLAATPARLRISTLDSLALSLVGRMPWLSRLGPAPEATDEPKPLYRAAAHATLAAIEGTGPDAVAARALLLRFDNDAARCEELLAELLAQRDQWLPLLRSPESTHRPTLEANLNALVEADLRALYEIIAADPAASSLPPPALEALPQWQSLATSVLTQAGALLKRSKPALALGEAACAALHSLRLLPPAPLDDEAWERLLPLLQLLPLAAAQLEVVFRERGQCDFTAVTAAACAALSSEGAPTALAYAFDARLQHLLVDEFQDTSTAQCSLVRSLLADWQPCDGRTVFLVGDPMQSIYGFRAARVDLFLENPLGLETLQLTANFRSQAPLVVWCNEAFTAAFDPEDILTGAVGFQSAEATRLSPLPAVELHPVGSEEAEAARVADLVERELASGAASIAILVHARSHLRAILPALRSPYLGRKLTPLAASPVATDLLAMAHALCNPADRVAWLALLRAPWCGLRLADLDALAGADADPAAPVLALWASRRHLLSADGVARAARVFAVMEPAVAACGRHSLRDLVWWCWQQLGGALCLAPGADPAHAAALLEHLDRAEPEGDLEHVYAKPDPNASARVQVMTIHDAKGLQFDVVILPGLARLPPHENPKLLHWLDWPGAAGGRLWALAPRAERGAEPAGYRYLHGLLSERGAQENLRKLYVAATRARERLHIVTQLKLTKEGRPDARTQLRHLWKAHAAAFLDAANAASPPPAPAPSVLASPLPLRRVLDPVWTPPPPPPLRWTGTAALPPPSDAAHPHHAAAAFHRRVGIAVHTMLQLLADRTPLLWVPDRLDFYLRQAGLADSDLSRARALATAALDRTVADPRGRWLLAPHDHARTEWSLTTPAGHARIDRSFVEDGTRWIVDYKLASHEGSGLDAFLAAQQALYRPQLDAYASLLAPIEPLRIQCALYFPHLSAWRAWHP
ncbi:MAG: UvrD-helicase domain-containing protein [Terriglobales bacterium]